MVRPWTASYHPALAVAAGQEVQVARKDPDNPGWRWCIDVAGLGGWLPFDALAKVRRGPAMVLEDFDSAELSVATGDMVDVAERRHGWARCRDRSGNGGWLPESCIAT